MILHVSQRIQVTAVGPPHNTVQTQVGVGVVVMMVITHSLQSLEVMTKVVTLCFVAKGSGKVRSHTSKQKSK